MNVFVQVNLWHVSINFDFWTKDIADIMCLFLHKTYANLTVYPACKVLLFTLFIL